MALSDKFFLPREEILRLTTGSYEQLSVRIETAIKGEKARLFENAEPEVLGTFPGYVVVQTAAGKVFRAKYEASDSGVVHVLSAEPLKANIYSEAALPTFLRNEATAVADLFLRGSVADANKKMAQLVRLVDETRDYAEQDIAKAFSERLSVDRLWKRTVVSQEKEMRTLLGEAYGQFDANKLRAKFFKLYDGSLPSEKELESYRGLVNEDLGKLTERLESVYSQALGSVGGLREIAVVTDSSSNATMQAFGSFAEDLVDDLSTLKLQLEETTQGVTSVRVRAQTYDTLAEEILRFELAGAFVVQMTNRLATASA
jgi:hypothetical protein